MITVLPVDKAKMGENHIRIHEPMPLYNPFKSDHRVSPAECAIAFDAWLRYKIEQGDKLIIAELERIARFACLGDGAVLVGSVVDGEVIKRIVEEALNNVP